MELTKLKSHPHHYPDNIASHHFHIIYTREHLDSTWSSYMDDNWEKIIIIMIHIFFSNFSDWNLRRKILARYTGLMSRLFIRWKIRAGPLSPHYWIVIETGDPLLSPVTVFSEVVSSLSGYVIRPYLKKLHSLFWCLFQNILNTESYKKTGMNWLIKNPVSKFDSISHFKFIDKRSQGTNEKWSDDKRPFKRRLKMIRVTF